MHVELTGHWAASSRSRGEVKIAALWKLLLRKLGFMRASRRAPAGEAPIVEAEELDLELLIE